MIDIHSHILPMVDDGASSVKMALDMLDQAYRDETGWARMAILQTASCGKFSSDRTIQEYVDDIWHLGKIKVR